MPAAHMPCHAHWRPAYENLQGRKPREVRAERCGGHPAYGDLRAARGRKAVPRVGGRTRRGMGDCMSGVVDDDRRGANAPAGRVR